MHVLVISGSMGAGKTTIMNEATDLLAAQGIVHAAIDLDALGVAHLPGGLATHGVAHANLTALWANYAAAGVERLLIAAALETRADLNRLRAIMPQAEFVVARLCAPLVAMEARVRGRELGVCQAQYVERVAVLERLLNAAKLEDFTVQNDQRSVTEVARDVLVAAHWL